MVDLMLPLSEKPYTDVLYTLVAMCSSGAMSDKKMWRYATWAAIYRSLVVRYPTGLSLASNLWAVVCPIRMRHMNHLPLGPW